VSNEVYIDRRIAVTRELHRQDGPFIPYYHKQNNPVEDVSNHVHIDVYLHPVKKESSGRNFSDI
jgi:hypothetical protein